MFPKIFFVNAVEIVINRQFQKLKCYMILVDSLLHSSLGLAFPQCKVHNVFIFRIAHKVSSHLVTVNVPTKIKNKILFVLFRSNR